MQWGRAAAGICECWRDAGESLALVFGLCRWFANFGRLSFVIYRTAQTTCFLQMPPATGKGTQACSVSHGGTPETFIFRPFTARPRRAPRAFAAFRLATIYLPHFLLLKWVVVKYTRVPLPVAGGEGSRLKRRFLHIV
jgi:hypothetical protein